MARPSLTRSHRRHNIAYHLTLTGKHAEYGSLLGSHVHLIFFFRPSYDSWGFPQQALGAYPRAHPSASNTSTIPGCHRRSPVFDGSISCSRCPCILFPWRCFTTLTACACKGNRDEQASWWYANQTRLTYSTLLMHV
jgi:hypothetical protein